MSSVARDLLRAAESVARYAETTQYQTPMFIPYTNTPSSKPMRMGAVYDHWVRIVLTDARETTNALSSVALATTASRDAVVHFNSMCAMATDRFERVLDYHHPYSSASNPHGMVICTNNANMQYMITRTHRAIAMEILAIHMARLQYMLLLTQIDCADGSAVLSVEFFTQWDNIMRIIHTLLDNHVGCFIPKRTDINTYPNTFYPFRDLEKVLSNTTELLDISTENLKDIKTRLTDPVNVFYRMALDDGPHTYMGNMHERKLRTDTALALTTSLFGTPAANAADAPTGSYIAQRACSEVQLCDAILQQPPTDHTHDEHWIWVQLAGKLMDGLYNAQDERAFRRNTIKPPGAVADPMLVNDTQTFTDAMTDNAPAGVVRFCACEMVKAIAKLSSDEDDTAYTDKARFAALASNLDDYSTLPRVGFCYARLMNYSFIPSCYDDRIFLQSFLSEEACLSTLATAEKEPVPGSFVFSKQTVAPRFQPTRLWKTTHAETTNTVEGLWTYTHCESALMADICSIMRGVTLANLEARKTHGYPLDTITALIQDVLSAQHDPPGFVNERFEAAALATIAAAGAYTTASENQRIYPTALENYEHLKTGIQTVRKTMTDIATPMGTTEAMPPSLLTFLKTVHTHLSTLPTSYTAVQSEAEKHAAQALRPFILNCDPLPTTIRETTRLPNRGQTRPALDATNHIITRVPSVEMEAVFLLRSRSHELFQNATVLSHYMHTSALIVHGLAAVAALIVPTPFGIAKDPFTLNPRATLTIQSDDINNDCPKFADTHNETNDDVNEVSNRMGLLTRDVVRWPYRNFVVGAFDTIIPVKNLQSLRDDLIRMQADWDKIHKALPPPFKFPGLWLYRTPTEANEIWTPVEPHERIDGVEIRLNVLPPSRRSAPPDKADIINTIHHHFRPSKTIPTITHELINSQFDTPITTRTNAATRLAAAQAEIIRIQADADTRIREVENGNDQQRNALMENAIQQDRLLAAELGAKVDSVSTAISDLAGVTRTKELSLPTQVALLSHSATLMKLLKHPTNNNPARAVSMYVTQFLAELVRQSGEISMEDCGEYVLPTLFETVYHQYASANWVPYITNQILNNAYFNGWDQNARDTYFRQTTELQFVERKIRTIQLMITNFKTALADLGTLPNGDSRNRTLLDLLQAVYEHRFFLLTQQLLAPPYAINPIAVPARTPDVDHISTVANTLHGIQTRAITTEGTTAEVIANFDTQFGAMDENDLAVKYFKPIFKTPALVAVANAIGL